MKKLALTVTAQSPLAIGRRKPGGSVSEAEQYIPGSVLRGAIASHLITFAAPDVPNGQTDDFHALFTGANPVIFQNAYPAVAQVNENELKVATTPVRVVPATAVTAKASPGFLSTTDNSGVFDTLIDRYCAELVHYPYEPTPPDVIEGNDQVEAFSGFYSHENQRYYTHPVSTRFLTRVGINRRRAVAEEQILYSAEVLSESFLKNVRVHPPEWEPVVFTGNILVPDDGLGDLLMAFINRRTQGLRIGSSRSRGLGKVQLEAQDISAELETSDLKTRIDQFNSKLTERRKLWSILGEDTTGKEEGSKPESNPNFFTIDLQSDTILTERWRRTTVLSPEMLKAVPDAPADDTLKLCAAYSSYDYRSGWNSAWGLMKASTWIGGTSSSAAMSPTSLGAANTSS